MYKVLHISDLHLGSMTYGLIDRLKDHAAVLNEIVQIAIDERVSLVIDAGDTFDSPTPDPWSVSKYNEFCRRLEGAGIQMLSVCGNHNRHPLAPKIDDITMMEAVSWTKREAISKDGLNPNITTYRSSDDFITVVACDWMPSDAIGKFLADFQPAQKPSIFILHQSCDAFLPKISSEVTLDQLRGKADYIAIGDIHVHKTEILDDADGQKTRVASSGSTEMCSSSESPEKFVNVVAFEKGRFLSVTSRPIRTRPYLNFGHINTELELMNVRNEILKHSTADLPKGPMIQFTYNRDLQHQVLNLRSELFDGYKLFKAEPETVVDFSESYLVAQENQSADMEEILTELLSSHGLTQQGIDLWNNPGNFAAIFTALKDRIRADSRTVAPGPSIPIA